MAAQTKHDDVPQGGPKDQQVPLTFDAIREPGAYVCHWSGHLLRVHREVNTADRSARTSMVSNQKLYVTRIGNDPEIPLPRARMVAREAGLSIAF